MEFKLALQHPQSISLSPLRSVVKRSDTAVSSLPTLPKPFLHQVIHLRDEGLEVNGGELAVLDYQLAVDEDKFGAGRVAEDQGAEGVLRSGAGELDGVEVVEGDVGGGA